MKIVFILTGGFAGLTRTAEINAGDLPKEEADKLYSLVEQSSFFDMTEPVSKAMPDDEMCNITIVTQKRSRTLHISRSTASINLKPLIDYLVKQSKYAK